MGTILAALAAIAGIVALAGAGSSPGTSYDLPQPGTPATRAARRDRFDRLIRELPLDATQRGLLTLIAYGETGGTFNPGAHNKRPSEVAASRVAFAAVRPELEAACATPTIAAWGIGSGGYGGRLIPYFGHDMARAGIVPCSPSLAFDAPHSIVSMLINLRGLQSLPHWDASDKRVRNLRAGLASLAYIRSPPASRVQRWRRQASELGLGAPFVDAEVATFPPISRAREFLALLRAADDTR